MDRVRLTETPDGLALAPTQPAVTPMSDVCLAKELPTLGLLQIHPAERTRVQSLPRTGRGNASRARSGTAAVRCVVMSVLFRAGRRPPGRGRCPAR
jgi:hypothetical protein